LESSGWTPSNVKLRLSPRLSRGASQPANKKADFPNYLLRLAELELLDRDRRAVEHRIRQAKFPVTKSLDSFDFLAVPALNKTLVLELARSEYLTRKENVLLLGNSGTGKTHITLRWQRFTTAGTRFMASP
jgi:DNA replication protein DnaC